MNSIKQACLMAGMLLLFPTFGLMADDRVSMQDAAFTEGGVMLARSHNPCNPCGMKSTKGNPCNPCGMKGMKGNPCNPCGMKGMKGNPCNPCGMKGMKGNPCNPCGMKSMKGNPCNPCGMKSMKGNPCGMKANPCNPCAGAGVDPDSITRPAGVKPYASNNSAKLVRQGEELWNDTSLSTNGLSCNSCHVDGASFNPTYKKPYPHRVAMVANQAGIKRPISAEQMIQFCMKVPMAAEPLPWDSQKLSALRAYVEEESQPAYAQAAAANPCGMKSMNGNPCNPCGMKANPCSMKSNPCAMKSNPCGKRW